jgi:hypothetical protein
MVKEFPAKSIRQLGRVVPVQVGGPEPGHLASPLEIRAFFEFFLLMGL